MRGFGWESVWKGGWFWVKVGGLVFIVEEVDTMGFGEAYGFGKLDSLKV